MRRGNGRGLAVVRRTSGLFVLGVRSILAFFLPKANFFKHFATIFTTVSCHPHALVDPEIRPYKFRTNAFRTPPASPSGDRACVP